jgi:hypothetical protein
MADGAATEERDLSDTERASIASMQTRCVEIDEQLTTYATQLDSTRAYAALRSRLAPRDDEGNEGGNGRRAIENRAVPDSQIVRWGDAFVASAQFRSYDGHGSSGRVELPFEIQERAPIDLASAWNTGNPFVYVTPSPQISTPLLAAVNSVNTSGNTISVLTYPGAPPDAAVVPEGALKPEADYLPVEFTASLETLAHFKPITRQALEDIPHIQSIVENALRSGIATKIDKSICDNLGAAALEAVGAAVDLPSIRIGIATVQANGYPNANTVLLNPLDWAALDIAVMDSTGNGPTSARNFWGLRPIASSGVPAGTAYVGDFKAGVTLFKRGNASVYLTDSHADYFVRNILVVLAEARAISVVTEARALVEIGTGVLAADAQSAGKKA